MPDAAGTPRSEAPWHPVGLSTAIEPGTANGTRLLGREIVVWRDTNGVAHVWEDRCPHRGMRLSLGFVRGDQIACLYHGWRYDASGQCRLIPAHPGLTPPETIRVPVLATVERLGMIWAHTRADDGRLPEDGTVTPVRSIMVDCAPERAIAHLTGLSPPVGSERGSTIDQPSAPIAVTIEDEDLRVGVQPLGVAECVLHVVIAGEHGGVARKRVNRWAEALRSTLERPADGGPR